ncbi:DoxX family protein [Pedobacter sp. HMF7647]|uniref:DoxX family protein n=1 Tax=Hufsiella arboris TaxID=2695275 RepID=A0A7K1Y9Y2_9SPHI|nr:DoxX family membrane protein [Hufsiella arboris]MXV50929.1 DoxX family protein [Hufsiella arboris]
MKIAAIVVRVLMGLMFLFASIPVLFHLMPTPELKGDIKVFMTGIMAARYLFPLIKITELLCGIAFVTGFFVPLAVVVIFPIIINIVLYHAYLGPSELPIAIALLICDLFLAWYYRDRYKPILSAK